MIQAVLDRLEEYSDNLMDMQLFLNQQIVYRESGFGKLAVEAVRENMPESFQSMENERVNAITLLKTVYDASSILLKNADFEKCQWQSVEDIPYELYRKGIDTALALIKVRLNPLKYSKEVLAQYRSVEHGLNYLASLRRMVYTSYLSNLKKIPTDLTRLLVVRIPPKGLNFERNGLIPAPELSPSTPLLLKYKDDGDWDYYVKKFEKQMNTRVDMVEAIQSLIERIEAGEEICLICVEKEFEFCHRYLLARRFMKYGIEWKEI